MSLIFSMALVFAMLSPASIKSRIIWSTSLPTKPTSVNFVASTCARAIRAGSRMAGPDAPTRAAGALALMNGAFASLASRRATSVLPTPVGPIIRMFLGMISSRSGDSTRCLRHRLRSATATARLASDCPTM